MVTVALIFWVFIKTTEKKIENKKKFKNATLLIRTLRKREKKKYATRYIGLQHEHIYGHWNLRIHIY